MEPDKLLTINNLQVSFPTENGKVDALRGISFSMKKGETLGIVGESGSGKSITALTIMGLLPKAAEHAGGQVFFSDKNGQVLELAAGLDEVGFQKIRGREIAMVFQEPMTSLNPVFTCGVQVAEAISLHQKTSAEETKQQVLALFEKVKLPDPERIYRSYPHQLSGGQRQRVMIAMGISCNPSLLIADEPTSALDVTVQRSILDLVNELKNEWGSSTIFISHDLGVVAQVADNVLVMKNGEVVEHGSVAQIFKNPQQPYTQLLLESFTKRTNSNLNSTESQVSSNQTILAVQNLQTHFSAKRNLFGKTTSYVKAVDSVSFEVLQGETLGLVGESGSGKTTLGRSILNLVNPSAGEVIFQGKNILKQSENQWFTTRKDIQIIFQDPYSSLNPRQHIGLAITEPMKVHGLYSSENQRRERAIELLETVGLEAGHFWRFPSEFSGGQRQRICIARALALEPKLIICDEAISSLDVTVQSQVLDLLEVLQDKHGLTYLFISHDLNVVRQISDRIAVMKEGKIVEIGTAEEVFLNPKSDYTRQLLEAIPTVDLKN
ncbi:MAG: dipeptide ABC transporter ATP-binding protein [Bacteroidetes bacterium]|nr:dipeptide ABC transporter ATP-binding protein [Bacteroidota bacterium]